MEPHLIVAATERLYDIIRANPVLSTHFANVDRSRYNRMLVHVLSCLDNVENMEFVVQHYKKTHRHMHLELIHMDAWVECLVQALRESHIPEEHVRTLVHNARTVFKSATVDLLIDAVYASTSSSATLPGGTRELTPFVEARLLELQSFLTHAFPAAKRPVVPSVTPSRLQLLEVGSAEAANGGGGEGGGRVERASRLSAGAKSTSSSATGAEL